MEPSMQLQIHSLILEVERLKSEQAATDKNIVNLVARSEFSIALISKMIADGTISRDDAINFVNNAPVDIPGFSDSVEQARQTVLQILSYQKTPG